MARSQEKAMSMLNRWVDQRRTVESGAADSVRSSRFPSECRSVKDGEASRSHVVRQIGSLIAQIQSAILGEQRIRELNDEINRLFRLRYAWEVQIRKLGGPDYSSMPRLGEADGVEAPGQGGYRYFGAAKELPGVRELIEQQPPDDSIKRNRKDLMKNITTDYYGWNDGTDLELIQDEKLAEMNQTSEVSLSSNRKVEDDSFIAGGRWVHESLPRQQDRKHLLRILLDRRKEILISEYIDTSKSDKVDVSGVKEDKKEHSSFLRSRMMNVDN